MTINALGEWVYTLDPDFAVSGIIEGTDPNITDTIEVQSVDGTRHTISIDINEDGVISGGLPTSLPIVYGLTHNSTTKPEEGYLSGFESDLAYIRVAVNFDPYVSLSNDTEATWYDGSSRVLSWTLQLADDPANTVTISKAIGGDDNAGALQPGGFDNWSAASALGYQLYNETGWPPLYTFTARTAGILSYLPVPRTHLIS